MTRPSPQGARDDEGTLTDNVLSRIHVISNQIGRAFHGQLARQHDLTLAEWRIVMTLVERPGATASEIRALWGMEKMAVSRGVARLEKMGRVARRVRNEDRRRHALVLTAKGRRLYARVLPEARRRYREITARLTPREMTSLRRALATLIEHTATLTE